MTPPLPKLYNKSYFEAGRRPRNRSLLGANEDFEDEPDAKRALLGNFYSSSARYSSISPGWQSSARQIASSVVKRTARARPVLRTDRLTIEISTRSESSESDILRRASITSKFTIIAIVVGF